MILLTIILMDLLTGMEFDLFVPSFPALQHHFAISSFWVEALLSINFLGYCISLFIVGSLADRYGRKPIILIGLALFILGSTACLWGKFYPILLIGRLLQGLGIAAPAILSFLIIADLYPLKQQQRLMAILNGIKNITVALAPVIGSYVTLYFNWQGNFFTLLFLGLIIGGMTLWFIPNNKLLISHPQHISLFAYLPILKSKPLMLLVLHILIMFVPYWIFVGMSPLLYIKSLGVSLTHFGYYQGIFALIFAFGSFGFGFFVNHCHQKTVLFLSLYVFIISIISISFITYTNNQQAWLITLAFIPFVIGQIIPSAILYPLGLNFMPAAKGRISALIQGGSFIFTAIGLQLAGYFYRGSFQNIGLVIIAFIIIVIITLFLVIQNKELRL